jgi:hypothetical protein
MADLFPPCTVVLLQGINPDVSRIHSAVPIVIVTADHDRFAILGDGNGIPKQIAICFPLMSWPICSQEVSVSRSSSPSTREKTLTYPGRSSVKSEGEPQIIVMPSAVISTDHPK